MKPVDAQARASHRPLISLVRWGFLLASAVARRWGTVSESAVTFRRLGATITSFAALALTLGMTAPSPANAAGTTWLFPSTDCPLAADHGLQDCIDKTASGDTIVITADALAANGAQISHSLTMRAEAGLDPTLDDLGVSDTGNTAPITVSVTGLTFSDIFLNFSDVDGNSVSLHNVNAIQVPGFTDYPVEMFAARSGTFRYVHGSLRNGTNEGYGVLLYATNSAQLNAWVIGTHYRDVATNGGDTAIAAESEGTSTLDAHVYNNDIFEAGGSSAGAASGIFADASNTSRLSVDIVGNTIDRSRAKATPGADIDGIEVRNDLTGAGSLDVRIFDNVLSQNTGVGISLPTGSDQSFSLGYNDFWKNGEGDADGVSDLGPHNLHVDPMYVDPADGNLHLRAGSPVIDAGQVCSPGGVANPDAANNARLEGASVDLGAYERGSSPPTGVVRLGTNKADTLTGTPGADILCGYGGPDHLSGGPGGDYLDGGAAADVLTGGPGPDRMFGGFGNDRLCAKDGSGTDLVDGGPGSDVARTDPTDRKVSIEGTTQAC
jgi:hypothetical protein